MRLFLPPMTRKNMMMMKKKKEVILKVLLSLKKNPKTLYLVGKLPSVAKGRL